MAATSPGAEVLATHFPGSQDHPRGAAPRTPEEEVLSSARSFWTTLPRIPNGSTALPVWGGTASDYNSQNGLRGSASAFPPLFLLVKFNLVFFFSKKKLKRGNLKEIWIFRDKKETHFTLKEN